MSLSPPTAILADIAAAGLLAVGVLGILFPEILSKGYGLPVADRGAIGFVRATAARDVALGAVIFAASLTGSALVLLVGAVAGVVLSLADFLNAFIGGDRVFRPQLFAHPAGAVLFAIIIALLIRP